jgi:hypothetical protein
MILGGSKCFFLLNAGPVGIAGYKNEPSAHFVNPALFLRL